MNSDKFFEPIMHINCLLMTCDILKIHINMSLFLIETFEEVITFMLIVVEFGHLNIRPMNYEGYHYKEGKMNERDIQTINQGCSVVELIFPNM